MRCAIWAAAVGVLTAAGCSKKSQDGLPPASEWQSAPAAASAPSAPDPADVIPHFTPPPGMIAKESNPHAGLDMGDMGDPSNPHAGLDMNGDGEPDNPHAGGGPDVTRLGLAAPDPDRPIDPSHRIAGTLGIDPRAKDKVKPGTSVFLIVKRAGPDGAPSGPPLAVDKLTWTGDGMAFELTEAQAMVAGTDLSGDVVVMARYDQDSDALSRQPGDVTGQIRVKIPAEHVKLMLDTVLP
ncbi:MAG TPA: hypothetical protein VF516_06355 [Kofleriaceae bacterium]